MRLTLCLRRPCRPQVVCLHYVMLRPHCTGHILFMYCLCGDMQVICDLQYILSEKTMNDSIRFTFCQQRSRRPQCNLYYMYIMWSPWKPLYVFYILYVEPMKASMFFTFCMWSPWKALCFLHSVCGAHERPYDFYIVYMEPMKATVWFTFCLFYFKQSQGGQTS